MYGGKHIARGDTIFVFASVNEGGPGLIARGLVTSAEASSTSSSIVKQPTRWWASPMKRPHSSADSSDSILERS